MRYVTTYDTGDKKRSEGGINEDSIAVTALSDAHREGYEPPWSESASDTAEPVVRGPTDDAPPQTDGEDGVTQVYEGGDEFPATDRDAGVFVLADGAGGEQNGDIASYIASTVAAEELSAVVHRARRRSLEGFGLEVEPDAFGPPLDGDDIEEAIEDAVAAAQTAIVKYASEDDSGEMYTTILAGVYIDGHLHYGWVGDSRIYVINERHEEITSLTRDHAKVTQWEDDGRIDEVEAHVHPKGNEILRALGGSGAEGVQEAAETARRYVETDTVPLFREDRVLFTSDGLIDAQTDAPDLYREYVTSDEDEEVAAKVLDAVVTDERIRDVVLETPSLESAAAEYVRLSNDKGGKDNISIIMFADEGLPAAPNPADSSLPERSADPSEPLEERDTVLK